MVPIPGFCWGDAKFWARTPGQVFCQLRFWKASIYSPSSRFHLPQIDFFDGVSP